MKVQYDCVVCGLNVIKQRSKGNMLTIPKFCSQKCNGINKTLNKKGTKPNYKGVCKNCGKEFETYRSPANMVSKPKYCSLKCIGESHSRENNPAYNGGKYMCNGYYVLFMPDHPFKTTKNLVYEHRHVMEIKMGRYLTPIEVVHHIDKNKLNNHPDNLMLFSNGSEHIKHHAKLNKQQNDKRPNNDRELHSY